MNHFKLFGCVSLLISACAFVAALSACTPESNPPAANSGDGGVVKVEKSNCETTGPMKMAPDADGNYVLTQIPPRADHFCAIMVPIDGAAFDLFTAGTKVYDYRRSHPTDLISHVVFFNTLTLEIAAIADVAETVAGTPQDLARATWLHSGSSLENVLSYFGGRDYGFAIELRNFQKLTTPLTLADARTLDSKFQRPYTYLFLDRHPVIEGEVQRRRPEAIKQTPVPDPGVIDGWPEL